MAVPERTQMRWPKAILGSMADKVPLGSYPPEHVITCVVTSQHRCRLIPVVVFVVAARSKQVPKTGSEFPIHECIQDGIDAGIGRTQPLRYRQDSKDDGLNCG